MPDWRELRVGDQVRIVSIPAADQRQFEETGDNFTVRVLRRLIKKRSVRTITKIDEYGQPWFEYRFRNRAGRTEYHTLAIMMGNESWVLVKSRRKRQTMRLGRHA